MRFIWSIVIGLIAFILSLYIISQVAADMAHGSLLAILIGIAVGIAVYWRGPWNRGVL